MLAAVCAWHERHADAADEITRRLRSAELMLIAAPTLIESYAVLTRLPPPHRLAPEVVLQIIEESFVGHGRVVALDGRSYRTLVDRGAWALSIPAAFWSVRITGPWRRVVNQNAP